MAFFQKCFSLFGACCEFFFQNISWTFVFQKPKFSQNTKKVLRLVLAMTICAASEHIGADPGREPFYRQEGETSLEKGTRPLNNQRHSSQEGEKEAISAEQELKNLQEDIVLIQSRLSRSLAHLHPKKAEEEKIETSQTIARQIDAGLEFLTHRLQCFLSGLWDVIQSIRMISLLPKALKSMLFPVGLSLLMAFFSCFLGRLLVLRRESAFRKHLYGRSFHRLAFFSALLLGPAAGYFFLSAVVGYMLHFLNLVPHSAWRLGYGALLPFHVYVSWAVWHWIQYVCSPRRPSLGLISQSPRGAHLSSMYLRMAVFAYVFFVTVFVFLDFFPHKGARHIRAPLLDVAVLLILWLFWRAFTVISNHLSPGQARKPLASVLNLIRALIGVLAVFWIFSPEKVMALAPLLLLTFLLVLMTLPLYRWLKRCQIGLIWRLRRQKGAWWSAVLWYPHLVLYGVSSILMLSTAYLWLTYGWMVDMDLGPTATLWLKTLMASQAMHTLLHVFFIVMAAMFIVKSGDRVLKYYVEDKYNSDQNENNFLAGRLKTLMAMLRTLLRIVVGIPAISLILSQFGNINITTLITSVGAASFGLTFGFQNIVKDFINGFFIILENNLMVGDEVDVDQRTGKVEAITLRTLKIRADTGMLLTIPFGSITVIGNKNRYFSAVLMNISVGYDEDLERVQTLIERAFGYLRRTPGMMRRISGNLEFRGVNEVTSYSAIIQVKIMTAPNAQDIVRRAFNRQLKKLFDEAGVVVPSPPHSVHRALPSLTNTQL